MATSTPPRSKIKKKYTWNSESVFKTQKEWENEIQNILNDLPLRRDNLSHAVHGEDVLSHSV